jgi:hypothetical protein
MAGNALRLEAQDFMCDFGRFLGTRVGQISRSSASNRENDVAPAQLIATQLARIDRGFRGFRNFGRSLETPAVL